MRRCIWAVCLLAAVLLAVCLPLANASETTVYQLALNDNFVDEDALVASNMPVAVSGTIYVPYSTFDRYTTGVDLGVSYTENWENGAHTLTLFTLNALLRFDLTNQTCIDQYEQPQNMKAILRNNKVYVPAYSVCQAFGLQYSYIPTRTAGVLIRIKNHNAVLSDVKFQQSSASFMQNRYDKYLQSLNPTVTTATPTPSTPSRPVVTPSTLPSATPSPEETATEGKTVHLAVRCTPGDSTESILETLDSRDVKALFLFRPEELEEQAQRVLLVLGDGHSVGFLVDGSDAQSAFTQLEEGNALLERLSWSRTHIACLENGGAATAQTLHDAGWRLWQREVDGQVISGDLPITQILTQIERQRTSARVELDGSAVTAQSLSRLIARLFSEGNTISAVLDSDLSEIM